MKKTMSRIALGLVLLAIVYWLISSSTSDRRSETQKEKVESEKRLQSEKSDADMVAKHNAVTDWKQNLNKKGEFLGDSVYTIEIEEALIRNDGRPILFFCGVNDIVRKENKYLVYFSNLFGFLASADVHFILDCTPDQVKEIMLHRAGLFEKYAVIARVSEVKKVKLKLANYPEEHAVTDYDVVETDKVVLEPSNVFIAKGCCLELRFVGDYELKALLENNNR
jgi:hypothetical protein